MKKIAYNICSHANMCDGHKDSRSCRHKIEHEQDGFCKETCSIYSQSRCTPKDFEDLIPLFDTFN